MGIFSEIVHHGGKDGVTGSCHELRLDAHNGLLIDCGLFQGEEAEGRGASDGRSLLWKSTFPSPISG